MFQVWIEQVYSWFVVSFKLVGTLFLLSPFYTVGFHIVWSTILGLLFLLSFNSWLLIDTNPARVPGVDRAL